jgi:hypothetical protein
MPEGPGLRGTPGTVHVSPATSPVNCLVSKVGRPYTAGRGETTMTPERTVTSGAIRTGPGDAATRPSHASPRPRGEVKRAREDASIVGVIPLLAVLVVTVAGVYIAWRQGSTGGGEGGVIAGIALLVGAAARLLLPARLAGLLATRKRATDVITLTIFGAALLIAGLVLPR